MAKRAAGKQAQAEQVRVPFTTTLDDRILLDAQVKCLKEGRIKMNDIIERLLELWLADKVDVELQAK